MAVKRTSAASEPRERSGDSGVSAPRPGSGPEHEPTGASERAGGAGPPSPRSGFGEVSPEPAQPVVRAEADGAKPPGKALDKSPARIASMFDAIARRYDLLNHVLSVGLDVRWRARAIREARLAPDARVLDLCTGTADFAIAALHASPHARIVGVDFAGAMLRVGLDKLRGRALERQITLVRGDATAIPVRDGWADAATIGFGIRNVAEPDAALVELARVIKPGGRLMILEFGEPIIPGIRGLYNWYFRVVLPQLGRLVSKHQSAYSYLPASVGTFPPPAVFAATISAHGFSGVRAVPLSLGIVYLYIATRG